MPIRSAEFARSFLDADNCDYVDTLDFFDSDGIRTGLKEEPLIYGHRLNERSSKRPLHAGVAV